MTNSTPSSWERNLTATLRNSISTEGSELDTEYNGNGGWPYFTISGHAYWASVLTVVILGLVGNSLTSLLLTASRFSSLSYPVYLIWLAISDSFVLVIKLVEETQQTFGLHFFINDNPVICKIWLYLRYITFLLSPWLVVALTLDRFFCVMFPLTRNRFCTRKKSFIICSVLTLISVLVLLPFLLTLELIEGQCSGPPYLFYLHIFIRLLLSSTLPCLLIFILNIAIIVRVRRSASFRSSFVSTGSTLTTTKQDKTTRPLVLVSVSAFVTLVPLSVTECVEVLLNITNMDAIATVLAIKLWPLFNLIYLMNFGQNFYILMASSANYRKIMASKLECMKNDRRSQNPAVRLSDQHMTPNQM